MTRSLAFSIVIPSHQKSLSLEMTLLSLSRLQASPEFETIVCFNLANDPAMQMVEQKFPQVQILCSQKPGANAARNAGRLAARGEYILFLDDDVRIADPQHLFKVQQMFALYPELCALGGPYKEQSDSEWVQSYGRRARCWLEAAQLKNQPRTLALLGGNMCFHHSVFAKGLRFDESLIFGGTETEFFGRLFSLGMKVGFIVDLQVDHFCSDKGILRKVFLQGKNSQKLAEVGFVQNFPNPTYQMPQPLDIVLQQTFQAGNLYSEMQYLSFPRKMSLGFETMFIYAVSLFWTLLIHWPMTLLKMQVPSLNKLRMDWNRASWMFLYPYHVWNGILEILTGELEIAEMTPRQKFLANFLLFPVQRIFINRKRKIVRKNRTPSLSSESLDSPKRFS